MAEDSQQPAGGAKQGGDAPIDVFFAYARAELNKVMPIVTALRAKYNVWIDVEGLKPGQSWDPARDKALRNAFAVVGAFSIISVGPERENFADEWGFAKNKKNLLPILLDPLDKFELPIAVHRLQHIDFSRWNNSSEDEGFTKLLRAIEDLIDLAKNGSGAADAPRDKGDAAPSMGIAVGVPQQARQVLALPASDHPEDALTGGPVVAAAHGLTEKDWSVRAATMLLKLALQRTTMNALRDSARTGEAGAQTLLGIAHLYGIEAEVSSARAAKWWRRAAEQGFARAVVEWATLDGLSRPAEDADIIRRLESAIDRNTHARTQLAIRRLSATTGSAQEAIANELEHSAKDGDPLAAGYLGWMYLRGRGVKRHNGKAKYWLQFGAENGDAFAQTNLGWMYLVGRGEKRDFQRATHWMRQAARGGHPWGEYYYALCNERGLGMAADAAEARRWYKRAADQGDTDAMVALAAMMLDGRGGSTDLAQALKLLEVAATEGDEAHAHALLGRIYEDGRGVPPDFSKAAAHYEKAVAISDPISHYRLGLLHEWGRGVQRDMRKAETHFRKAVTQASSLEEYTLARQKLESLGVSLE